MKQNLQLLPMTALILLIAAAVALSACGAPAAGADPSPRSGGAANDAPSADQSADRNAGQDAGRGESADGGRQPGVPGEADARTPESDAADSPDAPSDSADAPSAPAEPVKTHYMNKNYIFKPIDPDGEKKVVLLTFDDGPKDEAMIDRLLETLENHQAKAVFFLNGYRVEAKPELARKLHERGQVLGNHAWDHIVLTNESEETIDAQIMRVQDILTELTGTAPRFFRPPHGAGNDYIRKRVKEEGMLYMTWSNGSRDWEQGYQTPESVVEQVMQQLHPGSNILMHELPWTVEALDTLLTRLEEEGYSFLDPMAIDIDYTEPDA
jgi:peptidoglycan/xylan/chitin deacetylase (PgdA/CDA1 family)